MRLSTSKTAFVLSLLSTLTLAEDAPEKFVPYTTPAPLNIDSGVFLQESFDSGLPDTWVKTSGTKQDADGNKYSGSIVAEALQKDALKDDLSLVLKTKAAHHGIAAELAKPFEFVSEDEFVVQYEVNFQDGIECGGAYVKLLAQEEGLDIAGFHDKTRYSIMFGPDKCASDYKLHLIYNYKNPNTGEFEEKHLKTKPAAEKLREAYNDHKSHLFKLVMKSDSSFQIFLDNQVVSKGSLLEDMDPAINPPKEVVDETDEKPEDWDDREKIDDPSQTKPEDWDEDAPKKIQDPKAVMPSDWREDLEALVDDPEAIIPEDWDEEMDGEYEAPQIDNPECSSISGCGVWEAPMIDNPAYKGKWFPKKIKNPDYQGVWKARMIDNPDFYEDVAPFKSASSIVAVALEIWTMSKDIAFDNFIVTNDEANAVQFAKETFDLKQQQQKINEPSIIEKAKKAADENKWIVYVITAIVGLPVLYFVFKKVSGGKASGQDDTGDLKDGEEEDRSKDGMVDEDDESQDEEEVVGDANEKELPATEEENEEEDEEEEEDDNEEEEEEEDDQSSDDVEPPAADGVRKRRARRAD